MTVQEQDLTLVVVIVLGVIVAGLSPTGRSIATGSGSPPGMEMTPRTR
jgi:hypothetical protein